MATINWNNAAGGDWKTGSNWSGGVAPKAADTADIGGTGGFTVSIDSADVADQVNLTDASATLAIGSGGTLTLGATLSAAAGTVRVSTGGAISGGTLVAAGGAIAFAGGELDAVTYDGALSLSAAGAALFVSGGGLTLTGSGGTGAGTLDITGQGAALSLIGAQTLNHATVDLGGPGAASINEDDQSGAGSTLTLGPTLVIDQTGFDVQIVSTAYDANDAIVNEGSINAALGGEMLIGAPTFTNKGVISLSNSDFLDLVPALFDNAAGAAVDVTGGGYLLIDSNTFVNAGTISVVGGTVTFEGGVGAALGAFGVSSSTINVEQELSTAVLAGLENHGDKLALGLGGILDNSGAILTVGASSEFTSLTLAHNALIDGGVIADAGSGLVVSIGSLSGVTFRGTLNMSTGSATMFVEGAGLTLAGSGGVGAAEIDLTGQSANLYAIGAQTLSNATIDLGNSSGSQSTLAAGAAGGAVSVLTLGPSLIVDQTGAGAIITSAAVSGDEVVNKGQIDAGLAGAVLTIDPETFSNTGTLSVSNGDTIALNPADFVNVTGTTLKAGVFDIGAGSTLQLPGGETITTLDATAILSGAGSKLQSLQGSEHTIDSTLTRIGDTGVLELQSGRAWSASTTLTNAGSLSLGAASMTVTRLSNSGVAGGTGTLTATVANTGTIQATGAGTLTLGGGSLSNSGLVEATGGASLIINDSRVSGAGGTILAASGSSVTLKHASVLGGTTNEALNTQAKGTIHVGDGTIADMQGSSSNAGIIAIESTGSITQLKVLSAGVTLGGGGTITLGLTKDRIVGVSAAATLTNQNNTIVGIGYVGVNDLVIDNLQGGVIEASGAGNLVIEGQGEVLTNLGLMEAANSAHLLIEHTTVSQGAGGVITAAAGSSVYLEDVMVNGGTVGSSGSGMVNVNVAGGEFDGVSNPVTVNGLVRVYNGSNLILAGAIENTGTIDSLGGASFADLIIATAGATLSGGGVISLANTAGARVYGQSAAATLTNAAGTIKGAGLLGNGKLALTNGAGGTIQANLSNALVVDTGTNTVVNAGLIENTSTGGLTIDGALTNTGTLSVTAGTLSVDGAVGGAGTVRISGGTADFASTFTENVTFTTSGGTLELAKSQSYAGKISGFATTPISTLDLLDIAFGGSTKATFSGTTASGVLTVTDGTHTAKITLVGNYTASTFTVVSDGHGGTKVTDPVGPAGAAGAVHPIVAAMAGFPSPNALATPAAAAAPPALIRLAAHG